MRAIVEALRGDPVVGAVGRTTLGADRVLRPSMGLVTAGPWPGAVALEA